MALRPLDRRDCVPAAQAGVTSSAPLPGRRFNQRRCNRFSFSTLPFPKSNILEAPVGRCRMDGTRMETQGKAQTGIEGLDDILCGRPAARPRLSARRQPRDRQDDRRDCSSCSPARRRASTALYITLSETEDELRDSARLARLDARRAIDIFELVPPESLLDEDQQQSLLYSSDLELGETTKRSSRRSRSTTRAGSCSTACRRSACSRKARCATGARCWR